MKKIVLFVLMVASLTLTCNAYAASTFSERLETLTHEELMDITDVIADIVTGKTDMPASFIRENLTREDVRLLFIKELDRRETEHKKNINDMIKSLDDQLDKRVNDKKQSAKRGSK